MSWRKYAGGLSPGPAAIPNLASPAPGTPSLMTLGMCRDPLHRPLKQPGQRVAARPLPGRNLPRTCVCQLTPQQEPHRKALVNSAVHVGKGELSWGYG